MEVRLSVDKSHFTLEIARSRPYINWDYTVLDEEVSLETIEKFIDKPWNWAILSLNKNLTLSFVEKHLDKPWNFENLSYNSSISLDIIEKYPEEDLDFEALSEHPCVTLQIFQKYRDEWSFRGISSNQFNFHKVNLERIKNCQYAARRWLGKRNRKAIIIQRACHNWIWKLLCNDKTIGIRPRLDMIFLEDYLQFESQC